jgi:methionine aminopeptidase
MRGILTGSPRVASSGALPVPLITGRIRRGKMLATVLQVLRSHIEHGQSTKEFADVAAKELKALGGKPAFLGYGGFPDVLCVSVNDEVVHGIPRATRIIEQGDLVSMDFGVVYGGTSVRGVTQLRECLLDGGECLLGPLGHQLRSAMKLCTRRSA